MGENLATDIIKSLIKVIVVLIITNVLTVMGFLIYLSLPEEIDGDEVTQQARDEGQNSYVGGNLINGETGYKENTH